MGRFVIGHIPWNWKGGISKVEGYVLRKNKAWRHKTGFSKKYYAEYNGKSKTPEYKRMNRRKYKYLRKNAGELSVETIQMVYEDNIKKYGTLTCYLCELPIVFGKDHLEHRTPLCRGGTNEYENLAIACQPCNNKKHAKTEEEYRKVKR